MLSLAAPVALHSVGAVTTAARDVGQSFAQALQHLTGSATEQSGEDSSVTDEPELEHFAARLRQWFGELGISSPFQLRLEMDASGEQAAGVAGPQAEQIAELLEGHPNWLDELRQLAFSTQLQAASNSIGHALQAVKLQITDSQVHHQIG